MIPYLRKPASCVAHSFPSSFLHAEPNLCTPRNNICLKNLNSYYIITKTIKPHNLMDITSHGGSLINSLYIYIIFVRVNIYIYIYIWSLICALPSLRRRRRRRRLHPSSSSSPHRQKPPHHTPPWIDRSTPPPATETRPLVDRSAARAGAGRQAARGVGGNFGVKINKTTGAAYTIASRGEKRGREGKGEVRWWRWWG